MQTVFVTPRRDDAGEPMLVRCPERAWAPLPAEGAAVPLDDYWARRLRDGDAIEAIEPPEVVAAEATEATPTPKPAPAAKAAPSPTKEP